MKKRQSMSLTVPEGFLLPKLYGMHFFITFNTVWNEKLNDYNRIIVTYSLEFLQSLHKGPAIYQIEFISKFH